MKNTKLKLTGLQVILLALLIPTAAFFVDGQIYQHSAKVPSIITVSDISDINLGDQL